MSLIYLNLLSKDLNSIIASYLDYVTLNEYNTFLDFYILFQLRFPLIYKSNIKDYTVKDIYFNILNLSEEYKGFYSMKSEDMFEVGGIYDDGYEDVIYQEVFPETFEYLTINNLIDLRIDVIAKYDNVKVLKYIWDTSSNKYELSKHIMDNINVIISDHNSVHVLEFIFDNIIIDCSDDEFIQTIIYALIDGTSIDSIKIIIKYIIFEDSRLFEILEIYNSDNLEPFKYMMNLIDINSNQNIALLKSSLKVIFKDNDISKESKFNLLLNYFRPVLKEKDIIEIYSKVLGFKSGDQL